MYLNLKDIPNWFAKVTIDGDIFEFVILKMENLSDFD